jgi:hypothetical protein
MIGSLSDESNIKEIYLKRFTRILLAASYLLCFALIDIVVHAVVQIFDRNNTSVCETFFLSYRILEAGVVFSLAFLLRSSGSTNFQTSSDRNHKKTSGSGSKHDHGDIALTNSTSL